jgi:hypothetical protein
VRLGVIVAASSAAISAALVVVTIAFHRTPALQIGLGLAMGIMALAVSAITLVRADNRKQLEAANRNVLRVAASKTFLALFRYQAFAKPLGVSACSHGQSCSDADYGERSQVTSQRRSRHSDPCSPPIQSGCLIMPE